MSQAIWSVSAQADMAALDEEFSQISPAYGYRVGRAALAAGRFLAEFPQAGPMIDDRQRKWSVRNTHYVLIYRVVASGVEILRLQHARSDWRARLP